MNKGYLNDYREEISKLSNYSAVKAIVDKLYASIKNSPDCFVCHSSWIKDLNKPEEKFYCNGCKAEIKFGVKFCSNCGKQQLWALFG